MRNNLLIKQKKEAIARMQKLHLLEQVVTDFEQGKLYKSEYSYGALYDLDEAEKQRVKAFEEKHNALVYHIIKNTTNYGVIYSYLCVDQYPEEWEIDMKDINSGTILCYKDNINIPDFSEFGYIGITPISGGLRREF